MSRDRAARNDVAMLETAIGIIARTVAMIFD
jgi:hypothetical protein